jgi:hypothetical protein
MPTKKQKDTTKYNENGDITPTKKRISTAMWISTRKKFGFGRNGGCF